MHKLGSIGVSSELLYKEVVATSAMLSPLTLLMS